MHTAIHMVKLIFIHISIHALFGLPCKG